MKNSPKFSSLKAVESRLDQLLYDYSGMPEAIARLEQLCEESDIFLHHHDLMTLLENCRIHPEKDTGTLSSAMVQHQGKMLSELLFRYWQKYDKNASVLNVCRYYTQHMQKNEITALENSWRLWLGSNHPQKAAAKMFGTAAPLLSYSQMLKQFTVQKYTAFESGTEVWFYHYCSPEIFRTAPDRKILLLTQPLSESEKSCFLSGMLSRFPLLSKNGRFLPHEFFTEEYPETTEELLKAALTVYPKHSLFLLLQHMMQAGRISEPEHRQYWEYHFLRTHPCWQDYDYLFHQQTLEIRFHNGGTIVDCCSKQELLFFPSSVSAETITAEVPESFPSCCRFRHKKWRNYLDNIKEEYLFMSDFSEAMLSYQDVSFIKTEITYVTENGGKNRIIRQFAEQGTKTVHLPDNFNIAEICLTAPDSQEYHLDYKLFQKMVRGDAGEFTDEDRRQIPFFFEGDFTSVDYSMIYSDDILPEMHYSDYTEKEILQFQEFSQNQIENKDKGLWAYHGVRLLHFYIDNLLEEEYQSVECELHFTQIDSVPLAVPILFKGSRTENNEKQEYFVSIDTDALGKQISEKFPELQRVMFGGFLKLKFDYDFVSDDSPVSETYLFDIRMIFVNTALMEFESESSVININNTISIDFGTSSTCIAIDDDNDATRLIALTGKYEEEKLKENEIALHINMYENPTNLMIYNWDLLYQQWCAENGMHPLLHKHSGVNVLDDEKHVFDFGYSVKSSMSDAEKRFFNSVITQLKLVPYDNAHKKQSVVFPFEAGSTSVVYLSGKEEEDQNHFDPIAFYGYLLGRAVNNPQTGKIYLNYAVTYPVKFETEVRESIRQSLEYGIKRSLPKPLRDMTDEYGDPLFQLNMEHSEPVAYAGAICGKDMLSLEDDPSPKVFAVFDFGGGTLDFSFCMYRLADEEEQEDGYESVLQVFGVDGDATLGGERLINQISYWIVSSEENNETIRGIDGEPVPFIRPEGEFKIDGCDTIFFDEKNAPPIAKANTQHMNEHFTRKLFENGIQDDNHIQISLYNQDGITEEHDIVVNYDFLNEKLQERIEKAVENFYHSMINTFELPQVKEVLEKYQLSADSVHVFLAGNASRHPMVREAMLGCFEDEDKISMIDERFQETDYDDQYSGYKITPKTAVAIGQAKLITARYTCKVYEETTMFAWYVALNTLSGLKRLIEKGTTDTSWKKVGPVKGGMIKVVYSTNVDFSFKKPITLKCSRTDENKICYIRPYENNILEYIAVPKEQNPDDFDGMPRQITLS